MTATMRARSLTVKASWMRRRSEPARATSDGARVSAAAGDCPGAVEVVVGVVSAGGGGLGGGGGLVCVWVVGPDVESPGARTVTTALMPAPPGPPCWSQ